MKKEEFLATVEDWARAFAQHYPWTEDDKTILREVRIMFEQRPKVDMEFIDKWQRLIEKLYHTKLYAVTLISMLKEAGIEVTYCDPEHKESK